MTFNVRVAGRVQFHTDEYWEAAAFCLGHWMEPCSIYRGSKLVRRFD